MVAIVRGRGNRFAGASVAASIIAAGLVLAAPSVPANAAPFTCTSDFFYVAANQMYSGNPATTGFGTAIGVPNPTGDYNAIGYNPLDNYIYGMGTSGAIANQLVRIEDDGTVVALGVPSGAPMAGSAVAGGFDADGYFWIASGSQFRQIDVQTNTIIKAMTPSISGLQGNDIVVHDGNLIRLKPTTGFGGLTQITTIDPVSGTATWTTGSTIPAGLMASVAMWLSADERLFVGTGSGEIYELIDWQTNTPSAQLRTTTAQTSAGDGTSCQLARAPFGIYAQDDDYSGTPLVASGGGVLGNIWGNDSVDSAVATNTNTVTTVTDDGGLVGVMVGTSGSVTVPAGFLPGTYYVEYAICSVAVPEQCASATITVVLVAEDSDSILPATGGEIPWLMLVGAVAAVLGGAALSLTLRRKSTSYL